MKPSYIVMLIVMSAYLGMYDIHHEFGAQEKKLTIEESTQFGCDKGQVIIDFTVRYHEIEIVFGPQSGGPPPFKLDH